MSEVFLEEIVKHCVVILLENDEIVLVSKAVHQVMHSINIILL